MDSLRELIDELKQSGQLPENFLGLLYLLIGSTITKADGKVVSKGFTWRDLANLLKKLRWDTDDVRVLGVDPDSLPPKDRERYWYSAIVRAQVDSDKAAQAGEKLATALRLLGYVIPAKK